jgi:hypothetical protein
LRFNAKRNAYQIEDEAKDPWQSKSDALSEPFANGPASPKPQINHEIINLLQPADSSSTLRTLYRCGLRVLAESNPQMNDN